MIINYLHGWVVLQVLAKLGDKNIHTPTQKIIVVAPNGLQDFFAFQNAVAILAQKPKHVSLFLCEGALRIGACQSQITTIKFKFPQLKNCIQILAAVGTTQEYFYTHL